jgi:hypothetical protein
MRLHPGAGAIISGTRFLPNDDSDNIFFETLWNPLD